MKDWKGNKQSVMATLNASNHSESDRAVWDYYATPSEAVTGLLKKHKFNNLVWEPACGEGAISSILEKSEYQVRSSDIVQRGKHELFDFLSIENQEWQGDIITNPPFAKATEFLEKALQIINDGAYIAFFLRIQFLEGKKRRIIFDRDPPYKVIVASKTMRCAKNGDFGNATGNASTYAWFIWAKGYNGKPSIEWFN
jgi:hypothetical protein